ncbi:saccharopine dehydrogenase, putative [Eimeria acervulina]|uniref:Saccharopine dehydrogenase, putative n=1 Tax=Eimeria acervulina TaxID=5801 RepID=U6GHD8_EIMAC|nr:saccharopine dehydrogenase, putative [Eimeria acervulina]CDI78992.1 saccharopine dehydrogenase, putative [Eimeria acervulina]
MASKQAAAPPPVDEQREFHLGVLGSTGLIASYLCDNYGKDSGVKFIFGGRSAVRLQELKKSLSVKYAINEADIHTAVADVDDYKSLLDFTKRCRVLLTTVGPYMLYGEPVARACVETRTHYCDLTGEMPFVALLHARHGLAAKERGVKLISFCGFDSIPSDIAVMLIQNRAIEKTKKPCREVKLAVRSIRGGISGATLASALNVIGHKAMNSPYYLAAHAVDGPHNSLAGLPVQPRVCALHRDADFGYSTFYVMARVNENVVRWTNALLDYRYGYKETAKMAAEAALTVALQLSSCTPLTGVLSPAAGIGDPLVKRLIAKGITCKVYEQTNTQTPAAAAAAADTQTTKKAL